MDNNLWYDRQLFTMYYSQPVSTHSFDITTNESLDFASHNVTNPVVMQYQETLPVISYLKFYHFYVNSFYLITCKIISQNDSSFDNYDRYSHEFFYQHPNDPSTKYHVTCKLLPNSLIENVLNNEICEMNFDIELLSLNQKFNLEQSLKQKLFNRMHCNRNTNSFCNDVVNHEKITQTVSMEDIQNYNDGYFPSNDHTHQDTNGLKDNVIHTQQDDFNTFVLQQNNFETTH
ncbi:hypothetical protein RhiirC2_773082 [Rhizophagus irregularis]|uniref:Uncharacterized protein n=1 Tax=Rhizophagus irregularis TaxID=588596 RepID=A0A2N1NPT9_9GLOM|nr:hypothetical protein RhiirC2_773082 [Rhizophagus irregularis]